MRRVYLIASLLCLPSLAAGYSLPKGDTAQILPPQHLEASAGFAAGDSHWAIGATGRLGIAKKIDATLRLGLLIQDGEAGFESALGGRFQLFDAASTADIVDIALGIDLSFAFAGPAFTTGIDPKLLFSRHFSITEKREFFVGVGAGAAVTSLDANGLGDENRFGALVSVVAGLDIYDNLRFTGEFTWRDDLKRIGGAVGYRF